MKSNRKKTLMKIKKKWKKLNKIHRWENLEKKIVIKHNPDIFA
jgi:hypothetical protein